MADYEDGFFGCAVVVQERRLEEHGLDGGQEGEEAGGDVRVGFAIWVSGEQTSVSEIV